MAVRKRFLILCAFRPAVRGEILDSLATPDDFGRLAKRDLEQALQLFEYQDFVEAPFMQDARCRTLYDGLRGRPGRRNLLEEFLVALGGQGTRGAVGGHPVQSL